MDKETIFLSNFNKMFEVRRALNKLNKEENLPEYHYTEIKCIALIGIMEEANVTKLSEASYMTRGGISKTIKKLLKYDVIESYRKPENKKEIYYKLTDSGIAIFEKYKKFTNVQNEKYKIVFNQLNEQEKVIIINFLEKFNDYLKKDMDKTKVQEIEDEKL
jgi:DNA-binding MarR family transcriptional regulator